ncbi:Grx4 family monothiol glutaredoxin [Enterobacteriaceae endosymbiont of Neohaemonia nigricornis]|uniref:Grx4 family monothiol glutaredoxin n=1 Tax=Enterobacteriaceae endosymbiont of Neohaemonia nigricornis TaxID=2675792 RepID=UPI0014498FB4|nr:Grx4 family monothiol glutaredoxin [Enterobacteriaceae endosymbiont of Neohaemonia nigricornis]QJC30314.1 Grx4 family monothiol glutaredoxin [Enterobacteriaceae endosymbiont of Neohaemonia nigricornis]
MNIFKQIKIQIKTNPFILYMKGTPNNPQCGFSNKTVQIIMLYNIKCKYIDVLENIDIRIYLPKYANWPTFPQLWVYEELIGGYDIISSLHKDNKLHDILKYKNL